MIRKAIKKSILFKSGIAVAGVVFVLAMLRLFLFWSAPERMLKESLTAFFKENLGKAVKFEDVGMSLMGDLQISSLNMSISSDFNDNISLVQSPSVTIGVDLWSLLKGRVRINGIRFADPRITLLKRYDRTYGDTLRDLFMSGKPLDEIGNIDAADFTIIISNGRVTAIENLVDGRIVVESTKVNLEARFDDEGIAYRLSGTLAPFGSREIRRGGFSASGTIYRNGARPGYSSMHRLSIENFDVSYLNPKLPFPSLAVFGGLSINAIIHSTGPHASIECSTALNNLNIVERGREGARNVIANENMNISMALDVLDAGGRIVVRGFEAGDDSARLIAKGIYSCNGGEEYFDLRLERFGIDLARMSEWLTPWEGVSFDGRLEGAGRVFYDMRHNRAVEVSLFAGADGLAVTKKSGNSRRVLLSVPGARVRIRDGAFSISAEFRKERSDLDFRGGGFVSAWFPLVSESSLSFESKVMEAIIPAGALFQSVRRLYGEALEDRTSGYEQRFFMKTPLGSFVNNNMIDCEIRAANVLFGGRKALSDFKAAIRLADGYLRLERFSISGLGGDYGLDMRAYLKSDYPGGSVTGRVSGIDLEELARSLGVGGSVSGRLGADFSFEFSGNRKAHLIDNGKMEFNLTAESGHLRETAFQNRLAEFLKGCGYDKSAFGSIDFTRATLSANQVGENLYLSNMNFSGDSLSAAGYGTYRPDEGLRVPLSASYAVEGSDETPGKMTSVPLVITGRLFDPVLKVSTKKDSAGLSLFHID